MLAGSRTARWFSNHASEFAAQNQFWPTKEDLQHPSAISWALQQSERPSIDNIFEVIEALRATRAPRAMTTVLNSHPILTSFQWGYPLWGASKQMEQMGPALAAVHQRCIPQAGSDSVPASAENTWFWHSVAKKPRMLQEFHLCDIYRHLTSTLVYSNTVNVPTACVDLYFYLLTNGSRRSDKQALVNQECINQHFLHVAWPIYRTGISKCRKASGLTNSPWHLGGQKAYHQSTIVHEELLLVRTCIVSHWKCTVQMSIVESWTSCQKLTQVAMSLRSWIWTDTFM